MKNADLILKWVVIIAISIVAISIAFYTLWLLPSQDMAEQERYRLARLEACLEKTEKIYMPPMQKLIEGIQMPHDSEKGEMYRKAIEVLTTDWESKKEDCKNQK